MIPWTEFDHGSRNDVSTDVRIPLYEHWLDWLEHGPSQTVIYLESPMLELAHERQFVVTQQGNDSAGFEVEHTQRMEKCLRQLDDHFDKYAIDDSCCPGSPFAMDLKCCWQPNVSTEPWSSFAVLGGSGDPVEGPGGEAQNMTPKAPDAPTTYSSWSSISLLTQALTEVDSDEEDVLQSTSGQLRMKCLARSRAVSAVPPHALRSQKAPRQRRRHDIRLATDLLPVSKKRSAQWIVDKDEDDGAVATRWQVLSMQKSDYNKPSTEQLTLAALAGNTA